MGLRASFVRCWRHWLSFVLGVWVSTMVLDAWLFVASAPLDSVAQAGSVNGYIQATFGIQYILNITNYDNYAMQRQQAFRMVDNISGTQYWRRGDNYRIRYDYKGTV